LLDFTRYSTNTRNEMWLFVHLCLFQISWSMFAKNWQNWMTS